MAKVTYLEGDAVQYGYTFHAGQATEVDEGEALRKFRGNRFFKVEGGPNLAIVETAPTSILDRIKSVLPNSKAED